MFVLSSSQIVERGLIPDQYSLAKGKNVSPPLAWSGAPTGTKGFVLTLVDPDVPWGNFGLPSLGFLPADLFVHWMVVDIPESVSALPEGASPGKLPGAARELDNSCLEFGEESPFYKYRKDYLGMAPPAGDRAHQYIFLLYALNVAKLTLLANARYAALIDALRGKVLATASLTGYFKVEGK